jgi:hypothetical protein
MNRDQTFTTDLKLNILHFFRKVETDSEAYHAFNASLPFLFVLILLPNLSL